MGQIISLDFIIIPLCEAIVYVFSVIPFSNFFTNTFVPTGLVKLIAHRVILEKLNLYPAPVKPIPAGREAPTGPPRGRPDDGFGTDFKNPTTAMEGCAIGRNMPAMPKHLRDPHGKPEVQMVAQRLLARETFKPAAAQLNILAASWIQAMVHDWIGHSDGAKTVTLDAKTDSGKSLCPFAKSPFSFKNTKERPDGHFESERTNWWDASFVYGNNTSQLSEARTGKGGKMVTSDIPCALAERNDGTYIAGDNKNSWVGVALLQDIFIREHNWLTDKMAEENPKMTDQELFAAARVVVSALVAKIHTTDWTPQLINTRLLRIGMDTNWDGILKAAFGIPIYGVLSKMGMKKGKVSNNRDTPFCLTEEFAAVYRLHSLSPPGLILGDGDKKEFVELGNLIGDQGRKEMRKTNKRPKEMLKSCLSYPCGALMSHNYPIAYRNMAPTDDTGLDLPDEESRIDLAALDLYRDRERGILKFNEFRRQVNLKPYRTWRELVGEGSEEDARKLELIYGPGEEGIERLDLLVGSMYEAKCRPSFALSETSFIIFLLMASRRLDADPFLNELFTEEYYTKFGLDHVKKNNGMLDLLERHYPDLAEDFKGQGRRGKNKSVFEPTLGEEAWPTAIENGVVPKKIVNDWKTTKQDNDEFFNELENETKIYTNNLKANSTIVFKPEWVYIILMVLITTVPYYVLHNNYVPEIEIKPFFPAESIDIAKEFASSNVRHHDTINRILHLFTNPMIYVSQAYLLSLTPTLAGDIAIGNFKFNAAGIYFCFLTIYSFLLDWYSGIFNMIYLIVLHHLHPSMGRWVTRVVGEKSTNRTVFLIYLFSQYIQILYGHEIREGFYDWSIYQLFPIQQLLTVWNIMRLLKIYPSLDENTTIWEPVMELCKGKIPFSECVL